ncbi:MAG: ammonium transporter [Planctomycetes bacterium]|nr:ammonium transporter [Planctomycetota bacterium]
MVRFVASVLVALALACGPSIWAEETAPGTTSPAASPAAAAPPAAAPAKSLEERLAAVEVQAKAAADSAGQLSFNAGDNAWMLVSTALVLLMTLPGLALFYGGLVRRKNVLGTMMQSLSICCIVTVIWAVVGYAIAFGGGSSQPKLDEKGQAVMQADGTPATEPTTCAAFFGGFEKYVMMKGVLWNPATTNDKGERVPGSIPGPNPDYCASIPEGTFCLFQLVFAIITPALICGAYAERMRFAGTAIFSSLWLLFVYLPIAHMVWGKNGYFNWGFNSNMHGAFDFAGGTVVHISSGVAALMCAIFLGRRKGFPMSPMPPHSLVLSFIGASLLWVGWFGFNAGSALQASGLATFAFANTQFATAAAAIGWPLAEWIIRGKPTLLGGISGAVAGLVAITPAAGFVTPGSALVIGFLAGVLCFTSTSYLKRALKYDDSLDAFGVHGVGGMWGAIATGIFFNVDTNPGVKALNSGLYDAIVAGTHPVVLLQIKAVLITILISAIGSSVILLIVKYTVGLRVTADDESAGLDLSQHGEEGYIEAA